MGRSNKIHMSGGYDIVHQCCHCPRHFNSTKLYELHLQKTHGVENPKVEIENPCFGMKGCVTKSVGESQKAFLRQLGK